MNRFFIPQEGSPDSLGKPACSFYCPRQRQTETFETSRPKPGIPTGFEQMDPKALWSWFNSHNTLRGLGLWLGESSGSHTTLPFGQLPRGTGLLHEAPVAQTMRLLVLMASVPQQLHGEVYRYRNRCPLSAFVPTKPQPTASPGFGFNQKPCGSLSFRRCGQKD